jgi:protein-disulfide isomerase-like protein with CxxC motif
MTLVEVIEYTDPGCPWAWAFEPRRGALRRARPFAWRRVLGVQRDGEPWGEGDPLWLWHAVAERTGVPIARELAWVHSSTRPASLAVKAAERQGEAVAELVLRRLREAFFLDGRPPDTTERIAAALAGVPGLDRGLLELDAGSAAVLHALAADWDEARGIRPAALNVERGGPHPGVPVVDGERLRYAFPTLLFRGPEGERLVSGWRPLAAYLEAAATVELVPVPS